MGLLRVRDRMSGADRHSARMNPMRHPPPHENRDMDGRASTLPLADDVVPAPDPATDDVPVDAVPGRTPRRVLLVAAVVVAVARWLFAADRTVVHAFPDGVAQLAMARRIAGGTPWSMFDHATWQPGLATLIAPIYWITDDPTVVYRSAIALNCVIAGVSAAYATLLIRRLTHWGWMPSAVMAVVVAMLPASISASAYVWAEPLVTLCFLAALLAAMRFVERPTASSGLLTIAWSALGYYAHGRLLPMLAVSAAVVGVVAWRARRRRLAVGAVVLAGLMYVVVTVVSGIIHDAVWTSPDRTNTVGETLRRFGSPRALVEWGVGQLWYQLVTTAGLFGVGMIVVVRAALRPTPAGAPGPAVRDARVLLAFAVPLIGLSVLFMSGRMRGDHLIYGRYTDAIAWPIVAVAAAWMLDPLRRARSTIAMLGGVAVATVVAAVVVEVRFGDVLREDLGVPAMVAGLFPYIADRQTVDVLVPTVLAIVVLAILLIVDAAPRRRVEIVLLVVGSLLVVGALQTHFALRRGLNSFARASDVRAVDDIVPAGEVIGFHFVPKDEPSMVFEAAQRRSAQLYQMYLPDHRFEIDRGLRDDVGPYVFAPRLDPELTEAGAVPLWESEDTGMVLWREPATR